MGEPNGRPDSSRRGPGAALRPDRPRSPQTDAVNGRPADDPVAVRRRRPLVRADRQRLDRRRPGRGAGRRPDDRVELAGLDRGHDQGRRRAQARAAQAAAPAGLAPQPAARPEGLPPAPEPARLSDLAPGDNDGASHDAAGLSGGAAAWNSGDVGPAAAAITDDLGVSLAAVGVLGGTVFFAGLVVAKLGAATVTRRIGVIAAARITCLAAVVGNVVIAISPCSPASRRPPTRPAAPRHGAGPRPGARAPRRCASSGCSVAR